MLFTHNIGVKNTGGGVKRVHGGVNAQFRNLTGKHERTVKVREGGRRSRVGQVIGRHIHRLYGGDRTFAGRCDTFLHRTHFRGKCRLITNGRRHTSQQSRDFRTRLRETENVIDKKQDITFLTFLAGITERFRYRQSGQCHRGTCARRLVHLTENQRHLRFLQFVIVYFRKVPVALLHTFLESLAVADNARLDHFTQQVVTFTGTLADSGKYGESVMFLGNIIDQFLNKYGLSYTGTAKESDLATFGIRLQQVD